MQKDTSTNHPEQTDGEVFIGNFLNKSPEIPTEGILIDPFDRVGWKTKRAGMVAYDHNGNTLPDCFPVFVLRSEMRESGMDPDSLWLKKPEENRDV